MPVFAPKPPAWSAASSPRISREGGGGGEPGPASPQNFCFAKKTTLTPVFAPKPWLDNWTERENTAEDRGAESIYKYELSGD